MAGWKRGRLRLKKKVEDVLLDFFNMHKVGGNLSFLSLYTFVFFKYNFYYTLKKNQYFSYLFFQPLKSVKYTSLFLKYNSAVHISLLSELGAVDLHTKLSLFYIYRVTDVGSRFIVLATLGKKMFAPSISNFFLNAGWSERENNEMMGVTYCNKKDNRRLLLDYNFSGNPLLKSFVTVGYVELVFDGLTREIKYVKTKLTNGDPLELTFDIL